jgi:hypothetical protein
MNRADPGLASFFLSCPKPWKHAIAHTGRPEGESFGSRVTPREVSSTDLPGQAHLVPVVHPSSVEALPPAIARRASLVLVYDACDSLATRSRWCTRWTVLRPPRGDKTRRGCSRLTSIHERAAWINRRAESSPRHPPAANGKVRVFHSRLISRFPQSGNGLRGHLTPERSDHFKSLAFCGKSVGGVTIDRT